MKKALIVTAFARFIKSFLTNDILILKSMGYEVHCAANINHAGAECMPAYFDQLNVKFHQIDFSSNKPVSIQTVKSFYQLKELINQDDFDFVHVHTPISGVICRLVCSSKRKQGMKVAYTTHGFYFHNGSSRKSWLMYYPVENWMSKYSDAIITINHEDYQNAKKMHCDKVYYIPGVGVDIKRFQETVIDRTEYRKRLGIKDDEVLVLAIGELSERKNHKVVIEALAGIKNPSIVFMICGNAMTSANTANQLKKLALEQNVKLRLMGLRDDIPQICKCADIGVMPSTREGLGLSGIEMLASGLPLVASGTHGILDYIQDGYNGYIANPYDAQSFRKGIDALLDIKNRNRIACNCSHSVDEFDKSNSFQKMKSIYEELLN